MTSFAAYSEKAHDYAKYIVWVYPFLALIEEVGELYRWEAREARGDFSVSHDELCASAKKELGDILWNLNEICIFYGTSLEEIALMNLEKLKDREERGVLKGEGDER